jgi:hypothetical protein
MVRTALLLQLQLLLRLRLLLLLLLRLLLFWGNREHPCSATTNMLDKPDISEDFWFFISLLFQACLLKFHKGGGRPSAPLPGECAPGCVRPGVARLGPLCAEEVMTERV